MIDIRYVREHSNEVRKNLRKRKNPALLKRLDSLLKIDDDWRKSKFEVDRLKHERNKISAQINEAKKAGKDITAIVKKAKEIPQKIVQLEEKQVKLFSEMKEHLMRIPNLLHESVPEGKDDKDNVEVRRVGKLPKFGFKPKNHFELLENLGLIDSERANKNSGHGFFYNKGDLALLDFALQKFTIDFLSKRGYIVVNPPYMLRREPYEGVTDLADFETVMYKIEGDDLYLIATSEHPMAAYYMDEILNNSDLPIKFCGISPCFRREVGSHGKYTKGLFRMHQFNKIEQFIFCNPKDSWKFHEELQKNAEDLYKALKIPYRVVNVCTGDIGIIAAKKYDTEMLMADGEYREVGSNSNCTDYQARRLNIRYRESEGKPVAGFVHTLNNTAIATSRTLIAIIENNQNKDRTINIPKVLQPYMQEKKKIGPLKQ
ncbi:MAG: serine--tRNA ligase [Nanoarchaeota archaeon]|nr:serine--tRNA ligase [Nanoarchaeota archaeon]MBU1030741.1 serine--tRNA ligase [Nanoarchaeota archaeon]MBU1849918.1 serine--tRNA ligase [Nanoarchaeota archaeon]